MGEEEVKKITIESIKEMRTLESAKIVMAKPFRLDLNPRSRQV